MLAGPITGSKPAKASAAANLLTMTIWTADSKYPFQPMKKLSRAKKDVEKLILPFTKCHQQNTHIQAITVACLFTSKPVA